MATEQKRNVRPASDDDTYQIVEDAGRETVKRPSCKWKGQTDADEDSARSAGSPISRMPQSTKGGLRPRRQPQFPEYHLQLDAHRPKILNVLIDMKKNNKSDYTINFTRKALSYLGKHTSLEEPEAVKMLIAELKASDGYKRNLCIAYNKYAKFYNITWTMPKYREPAKNIALPTKEKLKMLIADAGYVLSTKLTLSMETGLRPVELCRLKVKDLDLDHKTVNPTTAKHGNPRTLPISESLKQRLEEHITRKGLTPNDVLFKGTNADYYGKEYRKMRNNLANKLKDPTIRNIRLYDLRHYFCTKKLNDIGNPYTVMVLMGHTKLTTTQRYMHLLNFNDDEWTCTGATTAKEATKLIENGFQYVTTIEGIQLFRKRK